MMKSMGDAEQAKFSGSCLGATGIFPLKPRNGRNWACAAQYSQHFSWDTAAMYCFVMCPKVHAVKHYHAEIHSELGK